MVLWVTQTKVHNLAGTGTGTETRPCSVGAIMLFFLISCSLQSFVTKKVILYVTILEEKSIGFEPL
jgi:hypothetical protein